MDTTRRSVLATLGGAATAGLAGCAGALGDGGGGGGGASDCNPEEGEPVSSQPVPTLGDGEVTVKAWEDYVCPHCATYVLEAVPKIRENYVDTGKVTYEHHDFPIPMDETWSWAAPSAARGVKSTLDDEAFFEMSHKLFENQGSYSMDLVADLAEEVGADRCKIVGDAESVTYRPVLEKDRQRGKQAGVQGTPAIFVNGSQVSFDGASSFYPPIRDAIEDAL